MKNIAAIVLVTAVTIFGAVEEHGNQGLAREAAPAAVTVTTH